MNIIKLSARMIKNVKLSKFKIAFTFTINVFISFLFLCLYIGFIPDFQ